jgi:glycosyltransferase involved in cell wall biosynthesis
MSALIVWKDYAACPARLPAMKRLSIIIVAKNEALRLAECLRSVQFADEIIVLDCGSSDGTPALAASLGATVVPTADWPGFGPQKNRALALATGDWVLSVDADERVTPRLREQVAAAIQGEGPAAYAVSRRSSYCGQYMNHSGWYPDRIVRLFRRGSARFSDDLVHERLLTQGPVGQLDGELLHESMPSFESVLDKVNSYSTSGAHALLRKGVTGSPGKALAHGLWAFLRTYLFKRGFLDGSLGLALAISNAEGTYYRYIKLWLLQRTGGQQACPRP